MIRKRLVRSSAVIASSFLSLLPHGVVKAQEGQLSKRLRDSVLSPTGLSSLTPLSAPAAGPLPGLGQQQAYQWKTGIVTTTFWVGEKACKNNPVPNHASSWDPKWAQNYGGFDDPDRANRAEFIPANFVPQQNPFYVALPYNDVTKGGAQARGVAGHSVVQEGLRRAGEVRLQRPLDRHPLQGPRRLRAVGRLRPLPHRSLAVRLRQRAAQAQPEQRRRPRCLPGRARLPRHERHRRDRLEVLRFLGGAARPLVAAWGQQYVRAISPRGRSAERHADAAGGGGSAGAVAGASSQFPFWRSRTA